MLDLTKMSPADAQHNIQVLKWLFCHREELQSIADQDDDQTLSMAAIVAAGGFNADQLSVSVRRLIPITLHIFTDDISLADEPDPIVAIKIGEQTIYPTHTFGIDADPEAISRVYGIDPTEHTWTSNDPYVEF